VSTRTPYGDVLDPGHVLMLAGIEADLVHETTEDGRYRVSVAGRSQLAARELHQGVGTAPQIVLATRSWTPGYYRRLDARGLQWERI